MANQGYTPTEMKQGFAAQMPKASLEVIENSHHALPLERPDQFNQALLKFLQQLSG